jgi:hypothetical protein
MHSTGRKILDAETDKASLTSLDCLQPSVFPCNFLLPV